jgi:hypothetical protein
VTDFGQLDDAGIALVTEYLERGPHPSYVAFENILGRTRFSRSIASVWQFLEDSVYGTGGFADGGYIIPFRKEITADGTETPNLFERRTITDYDQFAESVCMTPWDAILQQEDAITRTAKDERAADFWSNADRQRNGILDVLEFAFRQARLYLTGWLVVDAPKQLARNAADESALGQRPYMYAVRSRNVPHWHLDEDDELDAVIILEPATTTTDPNKCPLRVWSRAGWSAFDRDGKTVTLRERPDGNPDTGTNGIGVVPVIPLHDHKPIDDWFIGATDMLSVARLSQTVYNQDSEAREIERKAALFLAMGVKDAKNFDTKVHTVGLGYLMIYDGDSGPPVWVSPDFASLDKLMVSRDRKKASAYEVANMRAMVGAIETSSGFHALVEMSKSERAIARRAKAIENAERRATEIYLRYLGATPEQVAAAEIVISYPRRFAVKNVAEIQEQTAKLFETKPGRDVVEMQYRALLQAMFPRVDAVKIGEVAARAADHHMTTDGAGDSLAKVRELMTAQDDTA